MNHDQLINKKTATLKTLYYSYTYITNTFTIDFRNCTYVNIDIIFCIYIEYKDVFCFRSNQLIFSLFPSLVFASFPTKRLHSYLHKKQKRSIDISNLKQHFFFSYFPQNFRHNLASSTWLRLQGS